jgi:hypothetical protein
MRHKTRITQIKKTNLSNFINLNWCYSALIRLIRVKYGIADSSTTITII